MKTTYETGATTHATNDLILWVDNTKELAERRDRTFQATLQKDSEISRRMRAGDANAINDAFDYLLGVSIGHYCKHFPTDCEHIRNMTEAEKQEFRTLYASEMMDYAQENNIETFFQSAL